jgi:hypothetical protein
MKLSAYGGRYGCHPQALGQQELQLVVEPLTPMAEVGILVLEKLKAGEVLEVLRVVHPALTDILVG